MQKDLLGTDDSIAGSSPESRVSLTDGLTSEALMLILYGTAAATAVVLLEVATKYGWLCCSGL